MWEKHKRDMSEDILHTYRNTKSLQALVLNECLQLIEDKVIQLEGNSLSVFGLPSPVRTNYDFLNEEVIRERSYNVDP